MRRRALVVLAAASLVLAACRVDATVAVRVASDGSGTVSASVHLDRDAVRAAEIGGATLETRVRLTDLTAAGWRVGAWERDDDGATIAISKPFASPAALPAVLAELGGPITGGTLRVDPSFARTRYRLEVTADLAAAGAGVAADPQLAAALAALGVDPAGVDARLQGPLRESVTLALRGQLPGGGIAEEVVAPGTTGTLDASSATTNTRRLLLLAIGGALVIAAIALVVLRMRNARRRRRDSRWISPSPRSR